MISKSIYVFVIVRRFWIIYRKYSHEIISWVWTHRALETCRCKVNCTILRSALIDDVAIHHKNETIESAECFGWWLMDGCDYCFAFQCLFLKHLNNLKSLKTIESRSWLIEKNDRWICNKLDTDWCTFAFTSWNSLLQSRSDKNVCNVGQT